MPAQRKEHILTKLKKLSPGESTTLGAMRKPNGEITTSPEDIADLPRSHWGEVLKKKQIDQMALQMWMEELFTKKPDGSLRASLLQGDAAQWKVTRKHVQKAVKYSRNSMPGPDGIPAAAYKSLGDYAVDILHGAMQALAHEGAEDRLREAYYDRLDRTGHDFNLALLCCLPKKASGNDQEHGDFYEAGNTRPLALVNLDNRILASAARIAWEPILEKWVSGMQKGFLTGRVMLHNVLEVDYESMRVSLKCDKGSLVLFDFSAAFPSVSHGFMFQALRNFGVPEHALHFIKALYDNNKCNMIAKGGS